MSDLDKNKSLVGNIVKKMKEQHGVIDEEDHDTEKLPAITDSETITSKNYKKFMTTVEQRTDKALEVLDGSSPELVKLKLATMTEEELQDLKERREKALSVPSPVKMPDGSFVSLDLYETEEKQLEDSALQNYQRDRVAFERTATRKDRARARAAQIRADKDYRVRMVGEVLEKEILRRQKGADMEQIKVDAKEGTVEKREKREGVWVIEGTRKPNHLRNLLHKRIYSFIADGIMEHQAFQMWRADEEVRGLIASHYNRACRTWTEEEWIDNAKARLRADGKAMLRRFGHLPPNFPAGIMKKGADTDTMTAWMLMGGSKQSVLDARDTKKKKE